MKNFVIFLALYAVVATLASTQIIDPVTPQRGKEVWTDTIPDWDFNDIANIKIQYTGNWAHMPWGGSYPEVWKAGEHIAKYQFWGFGIAVYTELMHHHAGYIIDIDGVKDTVRTQDNRDLKDQLTYLNQDLPYGNHTVVFTSLRKDSTYVLNKLIKWVDASPFEPKPCPDSVVIVYKDSTLYNYKDTLVYNYKDTTLYNYKDSTLYNYKDSTLYNYKDSTLYNYKDSIVLVYDTISSKPCPPVVICPDPKPCLDCPTGIKAVPIWVWILFGGILCLLIILLLVLKSGSKVSSMLDNSDGEF